jgi:hypothetical protein
MNLSWVPGVVSVFGIMIVAGAIAYIGDRVGHHVGRKRMTLFGLRPKYTSTIVAVATGTLIALAVTLVALIASSDVRTAFFTLDKLNGQINALQAQAVAQQQELETTRNANFVVAKGVLVAPGVVIDVTRPEDEQMRAFSTFFDDTVRAVNTTAKRIGLQPDANRAADPRVHADLLSILRAVRDHYTTPGDPSAPILFLPLAPQNLFRGEHITFSLVPWLDKKLYSSGEEVASIDVEGGRAVAAPEYAMLTSRATDALARRGMPYPFFASPPSGFDPARFQAAMAQLARLKGHFRLVARSEGDLYPHSGQFVLAVNLEPRG